MFVEFFLGLGLGLSAVHLYGRSAQPSLPAEPLTAENISPVYQAAVLLMHLSPETCAEIFRRLAPSATKKICRAIARLPVVSPQVRRQVLLKLLNEALRESGAVETQGNPEEMWVVLSAQDPDLVAGLCSHLANRKA